MLILPNTLSHLDCMSGIQSIIDKYKGSDTLPVNGFLPELDAVKESEQVLIRNGLRGALGAMTPEKREELITMLKDLAVNADKTEFGKLIALKLPSVEEESAKGAELDQLLELLFRLMMLLGQANTVRNVNSAKFSEVAIMQAKSSGNKEVGSAVINLCGTLLGVGVSTAISAYGFSKQIKATDKYIDSLSGNGQGVQGLHHESALDVSEVDLSEWETPANEEIIQASSLDASEVDLSEWEIPTNEEIIQESALANNEPNSPTSPVVDVRSPENMGSQDMPVSESVLQNNEMEIGSAEQAIRNKSAEEEIIQENVLANNESNSPTSPVVDDRSPGNLSSQDAPVSESDLQNNETEIGSAEQAIRNKSAEEEIIQENVLANNESNSPTSPVVDDRSPGNLSSQDAPVSESDLQNSETEISSAEQAIRNQPTMRDNLSTKSQEKILQRQNELTYNKEVLIAKQISSYAQPAQTVVQAVTTAVDSIYKSDSMSNEAESILLKSAQHSEESAAQRSTDLLKRIFAMIESSSEQSSSTIRTISQSIKA